MTLSEVKSLVEELEFVGALTMFNAKLRTECKSPTHLRIWIHVDMPSSEPCVEPGMRCNIDNTYDLRWPRVGFNDPNCTPEFIMRKLYGMMRMFVLHELREGFRYRGKMIVPAHGPNGEFLPALSEKED